MTDRDDYMRAQYAHHDMIAMRDPERDLTKRRALPEIERLRRFRDAVIGWRECDWPEGFCRRTAQLIADNAKEKSGA